MERLTLLHRDAHLVVVHKPSGLLTHRGWGRDRDTALSRIRDMLGMRVHLPHRLDRGTSGVLVAALDEETHRLLTHAFATQRVHKTYLALVRGHAPSAGHIDHPIDAPEHAEPRAALTDFTLIAHSPVERCSLLTVEPRTGRPHQIRRHLKHIDHPLVGDTRYGRGDVNRHYREHYGLHRLALHAHTLTLEHPRTAATLHVEAPPPAELTQLFESLALPTRIHGAGGANPDGRDEPKPGQSDSPSVVR